MSRAQRWLLLCAAALAGCAAPPQAPWRVEPAYRVVGGGLPAARGYLALATQAEGEGRHAQALHALRRAAAEAAGDADVMHAVGLGLARQGRHAEAVTALRQAVAVAPGRAALLNDLGYALLLDGRADESRSVLQQALAAQPGYAVALSNLAHAQTLMAPMPAPAVQPLVAARPQAPTVVPVPTGATLHGLRIEIINGNGLTGAAASLRQWLRTRGVTAGRLANLPPYDTPQTRVQYRPGMAAQARELARRLPMSTELEPIAAGATRADLRVLLGHDAALVTALSHSTPRIRK